MIDHISVLMAVLSHEDGLAQKQAVKFLSMEYDPAAAELIWQAWAPHMSPPARHPLTVGTLAKDLVLAALTKPFPTAKLARAGAKALTDAIADLISTQTFVYHTVQDLEEETGMEVPNTSPSLVPALTWQIGLTNRPNTSTAPPSRLAPTCRISPSGHIPLGHGEKESHSKATDSQITLAVSEGSYTTHKTALAHSTLYLGILEEP